MLTTTSRRGWRAVDGDDGALREHYRSAMSSGAGRPMSAPPLSARGLQFIRHLPHFARLYWRLLRDGRVSIWPKALLAVGVLYVLSPIDLIPDVVPVIGEVDDLVVLILLCRLFVYLCPPEVVHEHVRRIDAEGR